MANKDKKTKFGKAQRLAIKKSEFSQKIPTDENGNYI
jgi:hypothetical protein